MRRIFCINTNFDLIYKVNGMQINTTKYFFYTLFCQSSINLPIFFTYDSELYSYELHFSFTNILFLVIVCL